ncbi:hypothetical protein [Micromonospora echinofusca]|uniref:Uncharacterized protein n=1 Tax=Micromonospora echinofusca TaxID=47858 RepID=A0ABS3VVA2_MICEH|nr:hypothetical protein [Micromonospora echinofusca]MBO4208480.1 hypothetical protein [Micromonospora echinofusca]
MSRRRTRSTILAVALAALLPVPPLVLTGPAGAQAPAAPAGPAEPWLTLVTGDRVLIRPDAPANQSLVVRPAAGREKTLFHRYVQAGEVHVVPADARPLVAAGVVDARLFNVSRLLDLGYADRADRDLPLIVTAADHTRAGTVAKAGGATVETALTSVDGAGVRLDRARAGQFWSRLVTAPAARADGAPALAGGATGIWFDAPVETKATGPTVGTSAVSRVTAGSESRLIDALEGAAARRDRIVQVDAAVSVPTNGPGLVRSALADLGTSTGPLFLTADDPAASGPVATAGPAARRADAGTAVLVTPDVATAARTADRFARSYPRWTATDLRSALLGSAAGSAEQTLRYGLTTAPASVDVGVLRWDARKAGARSTVTYRNAATAPVTIDLAVAGGTGLAVAPRQLTVPAGGTTSATVTVDGAKVSPGRVTGSLVASVAGTPALRTPVAVEVEAESYDLTITATDHDGAPAANWSALLNDLDRDYAVTVTEPAGTAVVRLPRGNYYLESHVDTARADGNLSTWIVEPLVVLDQNRTISLVATEGRPVGVTVDKSDARYGEVAAIFARMTNDGRYLGSDAHGPTFDGLLVRPSTSATTGGEFTFYVAARLAKPDGRGGFAGSPYMYHVQWIEPDRVPADLIRHLPNSELASVQARLASARPGRIGQKDYLVYAPLPFTIQEYYIPDTPWLAAIGTFAGEPDGNPETMLNSADRHFTVGTHSVERWNVGVFGPSFPRDWPWKWTNAARTGDRIDVELPLFTDQGTHREARSAVTGAYTKLYRNGRLVGQNDLAATGSFTVPAGSATYRLESRATRSTDFAGATSVKVAWTFCSATPAEGSTVRLPLAAVRFAPQLDDHNRAPAGGTFAVPVSVQWQDGATHGTTRYLSVEASYDGRNWRQVRLTGSGDTTVAHVPHPHGVQEVSLRARHVDSTGNMVEQTITRAYLVRR